jgi:hypothetical protein
VVGVDDDIAGAKLGERLEGAAGAGLRPLRAASPQQAMVRDDGDLELRRDEPFPQWSDREPQASSRSRLGAVEECRPQAGEVVGAALSLATAAPRDDRHVAAAHELLELRLSLADRTRRGVGGLRAEGVGLILGDCRELDRDLFLERFGDCVRRQVKMVCVL